MTAPPELLRRAIAGDQYVVTFGKGAGVGVFGAAQPLTLRRGDSVVVCSPRGTEAGTVLCPATARQARLLGAAASGLLLRRLGAEDESRRATHRDRAEHLFQAARAGVRADAMAIEILDAEVLLDGVQAILHFVGDDPRLETFARTLETESGLQVRMENLAQPVVPDDDPEAGGCGKPDCGRSEGGCSTCSTGGGCSSCGSKVDLRDYFGHLRDKMAKDQRRPLL